MTRCRSCGHPQANHHAHIGACTTRTAFVLECQCRAFTPERQFDDDTERQGAR